MRSLLDLISKHSESNSIIPIIGIASIIFTIILYVLIKIRWVKYIINLVVFIIGGVIFYNGYETMLKQEGLDMLILGSKFIVFGTVGIFFSAILDILDSLANIFKKNKKKDDLDKDNTDKKNSNEFLDNSEKSFVNENDESDNLETKYIEISNLKTEKFKSEDFKQEDTVGDETIVVNIYKSKEKL